MFLCVYVACMHVCIVYLYMSVCVSVRACVCVGPLGVFLWPAEELRALDGESIRSV